MHLKELPVFILSIFFKKYKRKYYTNYFRKKINNCSDSVVFDGKLIITDYKQLHIGRNVKIGNHAVFKSEGGIYISDNSVVYNNQLLETYTSDKIDLSSDTINLLKPLFIKNNNNNYISRHNFFVISTGRSGSNTIADFLSKHPDIDCYHENYFSLIRLSTEYAHGIKSKDEVKKELEYIIVKCNTINSNKKIIGDSDQKYSNLISVINEIIPTSKFIWLIRKADDFVASAYARRWFDDAEYAYPIMQHSCDTNDDYNFLNDYRIPYSIYRLNGYKCGYFDKQQWQNMSCFERCCWYWFYWNSLIEAQLESIPAQNKLFIKLEELNNNKILLFNFIGVENINASPDIKNKGVYQPFKQNNWTTEQIHAYNKWCLPGMKKWYGHE